MRRCNSQTSQPAAAEHSHPRAGLFTCSRTAIRLLTATSGYWRNENWPASRKEPQAAQRAGDQVADAVLCGRENTCLSRLDLINGIKRLRIKLLDQRHYLLQFAALDHCENHLYRPSSSLSIHCR